MAFCGRLRTPVDWLRPTLAGMIETSESTRSASEARTAVMPMLIERLLPDYDATRAEHRVMPGTMDVIYEAVRRADFIEAWRGSPAVRFLFAARSLGERAASAIGRRPHMEPPPPDSMRLADMPSQGEWVLLGEDPPREIAFGTIGRFWAGETIWERIDASEFEPFDRPGFAKIACNFSLRPYGADHTLVTYECRTRATDPSAREGFLRYWRPLSPFIGVVLRAQLGVVASEAARREAQ